MNMKSVLFRALFSLWVAALASGSATAADKHSAGHGDSQAIEHAMKKQFDKPEAPLKVEPVSVEGGFAVAGWLQQGRGGRALLEKRHGQWVITVCAGDGLKQVEILAQTGMKPEVAKRLAAKVAVQEARLPSETLKKFASFEGMLRVDGDAAHGHGHGHAAPMADKHKH